MSPNPDFHLPCRVPGLDDVDSRLFVLLVLLFVVVVGPLNFIWLSRRKCRGWLIVTIPTISLLTFLFMTLYSIMSEGLGVKTAPRSITWIDMETRRAATMARVGYFAGFSPADGLVFGEDTVALRIPANVDVWSRRRHSRSIGLNADLSAELRLSGGWIPARTPTEHLLLQTGPFRERLEFSRDPSGRLRVTNGFSTGLKILIVRDDQGRLYSARRAAAGATADFDLINENSNTQVSDLLKAEVSEEVLESWSVPAIGFDVSLAPGTFAALTDHAVHLDTGVEDAEILSEFHMVRGRWRTGGE